jgi:hypothetical protein
VLTFPLTVQPSAASDRAMLRALCIIVVPERSWHAHCEPCGCRLGQYTRIMSDHTGPGDTL